MANKKGNGGSRKKASASRKTRRAAGLKDAEERLDLVLTGLREDNSAVEMLEQIVGLITGKLIVSKQDLFAAVTTAVEGYEGKAKVSLIAASSAIMDSVARTAVFIKGLEDQLFTVAVLNSMAPEDKAKLLKTMWGLQFKQLDYVGKVSEMRLVEAERMKAAGITADDESDDYTWIDGTPVPKDPEARERLRNILDRVTRVIAAPSEVEDDDGE